MNNTRAHQEWMKRPEDERFESLRSMLEAVQGRRERAHEVTRSWAEVNFQPETVDPSGTGVTSTLRMVTPDGFLAPTAWAFEQVCSTLAAPSDFLRRLPADLAAENLNEVRGSAIRDRTKLLIETDAGGLSLLRAATGPDYGRIHDEKIVRLAMRLQDLSSGKLHNPSDWSGKSSGLYAGDRDSFIFMIDGGSMLDAGPRAQLNNGIYLWNSEVGSAACGFATFTFNVVCGNLIVWGIENYSETRIIHRKNAVNRLQSLESGARAWASAGDRLKDRTYERITKAQAVYLPKFAAKEEAELLAWAEKLGGCTKGETRSAVVKAVEEEGQCVTAWDFVQGLTASARELVYVNKKTELERKAGWILETLSK